MKKLSYTLSPSLPTPYSPLTEMQWQESRAAMWAAVVITMNAARREFLNRKLIEWMLQRSNGEATGGTT